MLTLGLKGEAVEKTIHGLCQLAFDTSVSDEILGRKYGVSSIIQVRFGKVKN